MTLGPVVPRSLVACCLLLLLLVHPGCSVRQASPSTAGGTEADTPLPLAFAIGEVTTDRAVAWLRCEGGREAIISIAPGGLEEVRLTIDENRDWTGRTTLSGLQPNTQYRYSAWCLGNPNRGPATGSFRTAPSAEDRAAVRFAWAGDVGGQNVCRDSSQGYIGFRAVRATQPDFFIPLGDMIYADDACLAEGRYGNPQIPGPKTPALDVEGFRAHWRYARADPATQQLYASTSVYPVWDDHEIVNDAGPDHDHAPTKSGVRLLAPAREAFFDYHPFGASPHEAPPMYRSVRWGRHLELFLLDTRSYRDSNRSRDKAGKSMLGEAQRNWLRAALQSSDATWKVIVSSVPISVPTGTPQARDGWAGEGGTTGFERELAEIMKTAQRLVRRQTLWLTTDVHFGSVLRYQPFADDPDFVMHEAISGPLNAGIFPSRELDRSFQPQRLYFHGPERAEDVTEFTDALRWFNFGTVEIDEAGTLTLRIVTALGETAYELQLQP